MAVSNTAGWGFEALLACQLIVGDSPAVSSPRGGGKFDHPMNQVRQIAQKIGTFIGEVVAEYRKTSWPERRELMDSTLVVITFIVLLSAVVLVCDKVIQFVLKVIQA